MYGKGILKSNILMVKRKKIDCRIWGFFYYWNDNVLDF